MKRSSVLLRLIIGCLCFCQTSALLAQQNIQVKVNKYIDAYVQMHQFSGSILIAKNGQVLVRNGYGYANYQFNIENTPQIKFRIGSLTKGFTALAIMQLVENNKLSLDDKLIKFIPDYPRGDEITLKHLLTCTSGIPNHTEFEDFNKERRVYHFTVSQTIETFKNKPLGFNPDEKFEYSSSNYILLGYIIEQISNMTYADYVEQNIFKPLRMENSGFETPEQVIKNMARGYLFKNNEIENAKFRDMSNAHASGALYSTVEDLYKWDRALYSETLISKESLKTMFIPFKDNYAYGWGVANIFNHKMVTHSGEIDGFISNISRFPDDDICIVILSNFEHTPISRINKDLIAIIFGEEYKIPEVINTIKLSDEISQIYTGKYELKPGFVFSVSLNNGSLFCQPTGQPKLELLPISESEFILKEVEAKISFIKNSSQEVEKLILNQGGSQVPALRIK